VFAQLIKQRFARACRELSINRSRHALTTTLFRRPSPETGQLDLF
jgi:hypothetical protein